MNLEQEKEMEKRQVQALIDNAPTLALLQAHSSRALMDVMGLVILPAFGFWLGSQAGDPSTWTHGLVGIVGWGIGIFLVLRLGKMVPLNDPTPLLLASLDRLQDAERAYKKKWGEDPY